MEYQKKLKPTKFKPFNKKIFGFDIETYNNNKSFYMASIVGENYEKVFYKKEDFIKELKTNKIFYNSVLFATNLSFDFFGIFFKNEDTKYFKVLFRGSDLLFTKTFLCRKNFHYRGKTRSKKQLPSLLFLDTLNYAKLSVEKMGQIINEPKLKTPLFIGKKPKSKANIKYMEKYNLQDSKTTFKFATFLLKSFEDLGATFGNTLASTSMSLFKNKFLKNEYKILPDNILMEQFKAYFGGRTEAFKRGYFKDYNYYDFNSLYPSIMQLNKFPNPNYMRQTKKNTLLYINKYEGVSEVLIYCPYMKYPLLPLKKDNGRVLFPIGEFKGYYSHIELREALKLGYKIKKVFNTQYFIRTCSPFKEFVKVLYELRLKYKKENNPMEYVVKILLNSLYGKFGQKWFNLDQWISEENLTMDIIKNSTSIEIKNGFVRVGQVDGKSKSFSVPIWAVYVTAYGRIKLHKAIIETKPIYVDTDSLITTKELKTSSIIGDLKLEMKIKEGYIVRPKFYALKDSDNKGYVKIKGLGRRLLFKQFYEFLKQPKITYLKFTKFKEAIKRDLIPNEIIPITKNLSLEDEKRVWKNKFNSEVLEDSEPLTILNK